jgi:copper homeostasis protein
MTLEMCVDSVESAVAAAEGGADRVELCANLLEGGTTPSLGTVRQTRRSAKLALSVMVRPRGGDFFYSPEEFDVMCEDARILKEEGADCLVFGLLRPDGQIDQERTAELIAMARPCQVTFHRAVDMTRDPREAIEALIKLGVERILTSGQQDSVLEGLNLIKELVQGAGSRVSVMPGCGVTLNNAARIARETGAKELHVASTRPFESGMHFRNKTVFMGTALRSADYQRFVTTAEAK